MHDIVLNGINLEDILYKENTLLYDVFLCNEIKKTNLKCTFMTREINKTVWEKSNDHAGVLFSVY